MLDCLAILSLVPAIIGPTGPEEAAPGPEAIRAASGRAIPPIRIATEVYPEHRDRFSCHQAIPTGSWGQSGDPVFVTALAP